ncbi:unnamed protein product [Hermetia illucens]|uniref:Uncharacterized protein n=1 Tax=Hermetia illucens TaxID=343691 RepID=A0A7R8UEC9_HERIL|nr:zinc finger protein chinmo isoform X2 [Hermetia illucens]CAD7079148.1 unnamed protein product [Hermetia illucens]
MDPQQQFCLKWNSYSSNLAMTFSNLFKSELLADVTLSCNGTVFKAHKLILAACSKKFAELFEAAPPTNGQCVVILEATSPENMSALLEFMYKGEVHVSQEALNSFLKSAENLQVKGLSTEHGRLAAAQSQSHEQSQQHMDSTQLSGRRQQRNSLSGTTSGGNSGSGNSSAHLGLSSLKQECDSLMHPSSSALGGMPPYLPPIYRPLSFDPPRKRHLRSPFSEQETRGSVLRDGSKGSAESASPINKPYRPSSSASSSAPTEADTMQTERASPQSSRYENHSPPSTTASAGNGAGSCQERAERTERNNGSTNETNEDDKEERESSDNGAEDLRVKMEDYSPQPPTSNTAPPTPTTLADFKTESGGLAGGLAASIAPADMLNVWNATKLNNKNSGTVNTADGKKLKCLYCDRLYGYETNLRAHIRQRHQGIRVPCPFCSRTFTRNNTVRRHIAREHKHEIAMNQLQGQNHSQ